MSRATMVALVLLRLVIGWHFFAEGAKHLTEPNWTSEGFLRQAKGPLAPRFQAVLGDYHDFESQVHGASASAGAMATWVGEISDALAKELERFSKVHSLSEEQKAQAQQILTRRQELLTEWLADHKDDFDTHQHEWQRLQMARAQTSADDVPYQKKRNADKFTSLKAEATGWVTQVKAIESDYWRDLDTLLDAKQQQQLDPRETSPLRQIDTIMSYGIFSIGVALVLGLFTRLASLAGALFLLSVAATQPFWMVDVPPYNQIVEMFALLALATTHVGRWGGLDFLIHHLLGKHCCPGQRDEVHALKA